ncbi:acyl-CoA thioester hydrolase [Pullulanibacillus pueri]|uniref:Thioesterase n=1 Tax=Pullulanibacillus pueri TaxID=1437324 RepID=A0A8J2ZXB0_9BACL|nr:thioesterase family protein [Pullulanibacillus pueri]MBM7683051.1 acyl-CoA thioester hydrolase [Pullulanibacillus pueri]GGH84955.1 thioesterase [Pullulanibacillus pueri]
MAVTTTVRVRFSETDAIGHVNNVSYFIYIEQARVDFLKFLSISINTSDEHIKAAVVSVSCDFFSQAFFDDELDINTLVEKIGSKSLTLRHVIYHSDTKKKIAEGKSVVVLLDVKQNRSVALPESWIDKMKEHLV